MTHVQLPLMCLSAFIKAVLQSGISYRKKDQHVHLLVVSSSLNSLAFTPLTKHEYSLHLSLR